MSLEVITVYQASYVYSPSSAPTSTYYRDVDTFGLTEEAAQNQGKQAMQQDKRAALGSMPRVTPRPAIRLPDQRIYLLEVTEPLVLDQVRQILPRGDKITRVIQVSGESAHQSTYIEETQSPRLRSAVLWDGEGEMPSIDVTSTDTILLRDGNLCYRFKWHHRGQPIKITD